MGKVAEKMIEISDEQWLSVNKKNRQICEEFLMESTQLSPYTIKQYTSVLRIYFFWVKENLDDKNFWEIRSRDYLKFQNFLVRRGLSSSAIKMKRSAISSLNNYVTVYYQDEYKDFRNYINKSISNPPSAFVHDKLPPSLDEFKMMCDELEKKELWQQLAYLQFSFSSGARRNEVKQLLKEVVGYEPKISMVKVRDENGNTIEKESRSYITHPIRCKGKGEKGKVRNLQFDFDALCAIKKWLEIRGDDDCPYVFVSKRDGKYQQISESTFNLWADKYFEPILGRRFHPHALREARATSLVIEQGRDIRIAQKLLGHNDSSTTNIYVIRKDEDDSDEAFV